MQGIEMVGNSIRYGFVQHFRVPAPAAYKWATSYNPSDLALMGDRGRRSVRWISDDTVLLSDTYERGKRKVKKTKLVRLSPDDLSWTSTHITGPNKYSQFVYRISSAGRAASHLQFTGLHVEYTEEPLSPAAIASLTSRILREDSGTWKILAKAMEKDVGGTT